MINQIGSGLSVSPHNCDGSNARASFPHVRIGDDVRSQQMLLSQKFGIEQLQLADGLARHAMLWSTMGFSTEFWRSQHECEQAMIPHRG